MARPVMKKRKLGEIAVAVKGLRAAMGLTQQQFSNQLGLTVTSIARYETGSRPSATVLYQLAILADRIKKPLGLLFMLEASKELGEGSSSVFVVARNHSVAVTSLLVSLTREPLRKIGEPASSKQERGLRHILEDWTDNLLKGLRRGLAEIIIQCEKDMPVLKQERTETITKFESSGSSVRMAEEFKKLGLE